MRPRLAAVGLLLLLALPGRAGHAEESTGGAVAYQFDAGTHHDAPDRCLDASTDWSLPVGNSTYAMLVPGEDPADHIVLDIPAALVGSRIQLTLVEGSSAPDSDLNVLAPGCAGDVFDPANLPVPFPAPPLPGLGEVQVPLESVLASAPYRGCYEDAWLFRITQLEGLSVPPSIHAAWTDGTEATVALFGYGEGSAWYLSRDQLDTTMKGAWANVQGEWSGRFRVLAGPCDATDGGAVYGEPPVRGDDLVSFTPIQAGPHVIQATLANPDPPLSATMPASCHYCLGPSTAEAARNASFRLTAVQV